MTKYEKVNTLISGLALLLSIVSPIATYIWLDPQLQAFRHRARLQASGEQTDPKVSVESVIEQQTIAPGDSATVMFSVKYQTARVAITNIGDLPAKEVTLTTQYDSSVTDPEAPVATPAMPVEITRQQNAIFVKLKQPIAPKDTIIFKFSDPPLSLFVTDENGERAAVQFVPSQISLDSSMFPKPKNQITWPPLK